jgi:hypothetical protein
VNQNNENDTYNVASGPVPTPRGGGRKRSAKDMRVPMDLTRSRKVGLTRIVCSSCGAAYDQGYCRHNPADHTHAHKVVIKTGPMKPDQTSTETGWYQDLDASACLR